MRQHPGSIEEFLLRTIPASLTEERFCMFVLESFGSFPLSVQRIIVQNQAKGGPAFVVALSCIPETRRILKDSAIAGEMRASTIGFKELSSENRASLVDQIDSTWPKIEAAAMNTESIYISIAKIHIQQTERAWQTLRDALGNDIASLRSVANWLVARARLHERLGKTQLALADYGEALGLFERVTSLETKPTSDALRAVVVARDKIGNVLESRGDIAAAQERYERSLFDCENILLSSDTENLVAQRDKRISLLNVGITNKIQGNREASKIYIEQALLLSESTFRTLGNERPLAVNDYAHNLDEAGDLELELANLESARLYYEKSLALRLDVYERTGLTWLDTGINLSTSLNKMGDIHRSIGNFTEAFNLYRRSLEISEQVDNYDNVLRDSRANNLDVLKTISNSLQNLGIVLQHLSDSGNASERLQTAMQLRIQICEIGNQEEPQPLIDLSNSLIRLADIHRNDGNLDMAFTYLSEARSLRVQALNLYTTDPPHALREVSLCLNKVGDVLLALHEPAEALSLFRESLKICFQVLRIVGTDQPREMIDWCHAASRVASVTIDSSLATESLERAISIVKQYPRLLEFRSLQVFAYITSLNVGASKPNVRKDY